MLPLPAMRRVVGLEKVLRSSELVPARVALVVLMRMPTSEEAGARRGRKSMSAAMPR